MLPHSGDWSTKAHSRANCASVRLRPNCSSDRKQVSPVPAGERIKGVLRARAQECLDAVEEWLPKMIGPEIVRPWRDDRRGGLRDSAAQHGPFSCFRPGFRG